MAESFSFEQAVVATARNKFEAAQARANPDSTHEKPRDVILTACTAIAKALEPDGFTLLKSGPRLKRTEGDLTFEIMFQSDRDNIAGKRAAVWIHAGVSSRKLASWRGSHPGECLRRSGHQAGMIGGGQIGNLGVSPTWMEWDFADPETRAGQIEDAVGAIREIILPHFTVFEDPAQAFAILIRHKLMNQVSLLEYALASIDRNIAEAEGRSLLKASPDLNRRFSNAFRLYVETGPRLYTGDLGSDLASLAVAAGLDLRAQAEG